MSETILKAHNIFKSFDSPNGKIEVLKGVFLELKKGEKIIIQGPSGSGKTTLLMILSLLDKPDKGKIFYKEIEVFWAENKFVSKLRNEKFGFIFQFYNLINELNALENVMVPLLIKGMNFKDARKKAEEYLELVGLYSRRFSFPTQLSGGEEQRVAIARALVNEPEIIFADEPTGNLDEKNAMKIMNLLFELVDKNGVSLIMVSHNPYWLKYFNKGFYLANGKLNEIEV